MMFSVSISSSDDELQLGHDEDKKKLAVHSTAKRKHSSEPAFIPQDESELDSPKSDFSPVIHPLKRKYEAVTVGDSKDEDVLDLPGDFSSPIMKKPHLSKTPISCIIFTARTTASFSVNGQKTKPQFRKIIEGCKEAEA
jgi:hypothetical protein